MNVQKGRLMHGLTSFLTLMDVLNSNPLSRGLRALDPGPQPVCWHPLKNSSLEVKNSMIEDPASGRGTLEEYIYL